MEQALSSAPFSSNFFEIINLKYAMLTQMIGRLNSIAEYFLDDEGNQLQFTVKKGTDQTFLWKLTIRILATKFKTGQQGPRTCRQLRLNEFVNVYNYISQQSEAMKVCQQAEPPIESSPQAATACAAASNTTAVPTYPHESDCMKQSKLYDSIMMSGSNSEVKDKEVCCICMDAVCSVILACTHGYCENCIKQWQVTSNTCPICRSKAVEKDAFVLADKPDYFILQDEMHKSLFQLTDSGDKHQRPTQSSSSEDD